jgi:hypothetical protein
MTLTLETDGATYVIFFQHVDFVDYITQNIPGKPPDINVCVPAITEAKPPHRIFIDLECILNYLHQKEPKWKYLSNENKDAAIINFLIININHESLHKAIFEAPEIRDYLEKVSHILNEEAREGNENVISRMEYEL